MPAFTSLTVNDRQDPVVAHTLTPNSDKDGVSRFVEAAVVPIGDKRLTISKRLTNGRYRVRIDLAIPVLVTETINGVEKYKVERTSYVNCEFTFADTSTLQERKDTVGIFAGALGADVTVIDSVLTGLEDIW